MCDISKCLCRVTASAKWIEKKWSGGLKKSGLDRKKKKVVRIGKKIGKNVR